MWDCVETSSSFLVLPPHRAPPPLLQAAGVLSAGVRSMFFLPLALCGPEQSGVSEGFVSSALLLLFSPSCLLTGFTGWQASAVARASQFFLCGQVTSHNRAALGEVNALVPTFLKKQSLIQSVSTLSQFLFSQALMEQGIVRGEEGLLSLFSCYNGHY